MKKYLKLTIFTLFCLLLTGCGDSDSMAVTDYLNLYTSLDESVLSDMNDVIAEENLSEENQNLYEKIFKKQYSDLSYEVTSEEYDGDEATVTVKITVYDLYKAQNDASKYLANNPDEFNDDSGAYDINKFMAYKLKQMQNMTDTVEYTIDFYVVKSSEGWVVSSLSDSDLEKIHGIYNYES